MKIERFFKKNQLLESLKIYFVTKFTNQSSLKSHTQACKRVKEPDCGREINVLYITNYFLSFNKFDGIKVCTKKNYIKNKNKSSYWLCNKCTEKSEEGDRLSRTKEELQYWRYRRKSAFIISKFHGSIEFLKSFHWYRHYKRCYRHGLLKIN